MVIVYRAFLAHFCTVFVARLLKTENPVENIGLETITTLLLKHHFDSNKAKQSVSKYKSLSSGFVPPSLKYNSLDIDSISTLVRINKSAIFIE